MVVLGGWLDSMIIVVISNLCFCDSVIRVEVHTEGVFDPFHSLLWLVISHLRHTLI